MWSQVILFVCCAKASSPLSLLATSIILAERLDWHNRLMPRRLGLAGRNNRPGSSSRNGEPTGLHDDPVQHLQHALNFIAFDDPGHAMSALAAQFETEGVLLARNRQPVR